MLDCSRRAPGYFTILVARLRLPHSVVKELHVHKTGVAILTQEIAGSFDDYQLARFSTLDALSLIRVK